MRIFSFVYVEQEGLFYVVGVLYTVLEYLNGVEEQLCTIHNIDDIGRTYVFV